MDPLEIEDIDEWLSCPTPFETSQHFPERLVTTQMNRERIWTEG